MDIMTRKKSLSKGEILAKHIIEQYNPQSIEDMQNALKDIFGPMFEAMLQGEMIDHQVRAKMLPYRHPLRRGKTKQFIETDHSNEIV